MSASYTQNEKGEKHAYLGIGIGLEVGSGLGFGSG